MQATKRTRKCSIQIRTIQLLAVWCFSISFHPMCQGGRFPEMEPVNVWLRESIAKENHRLPNSMSSPLRLTLPRPSFWSWAPLGFWRPYWQGAFATTITAIVLCHQCLGPLPGSHASIRFNLKTRSGSQASNTNTQSLTSTVIQFNSQRPQLFGLFIMRHKLIGSSWPLKLSNRHQRFALSIEPWGGMIAYDCGKGR